MPVPIAEAHAPNMQSCHDQACQLMLQSGTLVCDRESYRLLLLLHNLPNARHNATEHTVQQGMACGIHQPRAVSRCQVVHMWMLAAVRPHPSQSSQPIACHSPELDGPLPLYKLLAS